MTGTKTKGAAPGVALMDALLRGDLDHVSELLAADVHVRGLQPHEPFEADGRDAAVALYAAGYVNDAMQRIEVLDTGAIGDRQYLAYRCEWRVPPEFAEAVGQLAGTTMAFQQHVFYDTDDDGRITWLHLLCSGNHPVS